ncbi:inner membrane protein CreD [Klebsiella pneumoniae]|uniref:Inner membrane protein CreD n=1 Tax=Klebsiella pneumoniae TaxID=573 RepID=A0A377UUD5_KLEPN|nr:inner membrane protein CreD [Klebsiella pneumoniae]
MAQVFICQCLRRPEDNKPLEIAFSLDLNGTGEFSLVPLGRNSELQLTQ